MKRQTDFICSHLIICSMEHRAFFSATTLIFGHISEITMNILRERYQFHHRQQKPHETVEQFVSDVRRLASTCQFRSLEETLIRDHVLFGLRNKKVSLEVIENGGDPSLYEIIDICSKFGRNMRITRQRIIADEHKPKGKLQLQKHMN